MRLFSVTQILSPFSKYDGIPPAVLKAASERGQRIHAAAAAHLSGTFQVVGLQPEDVPYWDSLKDWIDSNVEHVYEVEPELVDEQLGFMGHPDLICRVRGRAVVADWKTPQVEQPSWKIQLAAYCHLAGQAYRAYSPAWRGMAVQPDKDGGPAKATPYQHSQQDFGVFLSCLNAYRFFN